jgi:hypothetical protein
MFIALRWPCLLRKISTCRRSTNVRLGACDLRIAYVGRIDSDTLRRAADDVACTLRKTTDVGNARRRGTDSVSTNLRGTTDVGMNTGSLYRYNRRDRGLAVLPELEVQWPPGPEVLPLEVETGVPLADRSDERQQSEPGDAVPLEVGR